MSKTVHSTFKGLNTQVKASLLYFLVNLENSDFDRVILEDEQWEDFTLVFKSGKRVICESKNWKKPLNWTDIKNILNKVISKKTLRVEDKIEIICSNLLPEIKENKDYFNYELPSIKKIYKDNSFSDKQIKLLKKTHFYEIPTNDPDQSLYEGCLVYLYRQISYWLPEHELENLLDSILVHEIYEKSAKGTAFTRNELFSRINLYKDKKIKSSSAYDSDKREKEDQIKSVLEAIESNDRNYLMRDGHLTSLTAQPELMRLALDKLKQKQIKLEDWEFLWEPLIGRFYAFNVLLIFEDNISDKENAKYAVSFIRKKYIQIVALVRDDYAHTFALETVKRALKRHTEVKEDALALIEEILKKRGETYKDLKGKHEFNRERNLVAEILKMIFEKNTSQKIINLIKNHFSLVSDEGNFSLYTPPEIFQILLKFIELDFEKNFKKVVKLVIEEYKRTYLKKKELSKREGDHFFYGYEHMGMSISSANGHCSINDRHFIEKTLAPAIAKYYKEEPEKCWGFILDYCVQTQAVDRKVSTNKPDFLNRLSLPILFDKYFKGEDEEVELAFEILSEFATLRRGIPHKADLIFQEFRRWSNREEKKWELVKVVIDKWKLPINPFIDDIVLQLFQSSEEKIKVWAQETIKSWFKNPKYFERDSLARKEISHTLSSLIEKEETRELGIELFKSFISTSHFKEKYDQFYVYDLGRVINMLLKSDFDKGVGILIELKKQSNLTWNQQTLLTHSFLNLHDKESDNKEFLNRLYDRFVDDWLTEMGNENSKIVQKLTESYPRQRIVEFAEALAKEKEIKKALRIIECFIDDPDPCLPEEEKDEESKKYNEHKKIIEGQGTPVITSVRGYCAWTMQHCLVMEGREPEILRRIIEFTKKLASHDEKNYYIKHMVCYPLARLAQLRLAHTGDHETLFFSDDVKEALETAKEIEGVAFDLLEQFTEYPETVQKELIKSILSVLNYIRGLNTEDTKRIVELLLKFPGEAIGEAAALFIYFAYYREGAFKDWKWQKEGLYDDLAEFDSEHFVNQLDNLLSKDDSCLRSKFAWQFFLLTDHRNHPSKKDYDRGFEFAHENLRKLMQHYDKDTFGTIFRFIKDNIEHKFEDCFKLFMDWLDKVPDEKGINDLGYQQYDELLEEIKTIGDDMKFLNALNKLLDKSGNALWGRLDRTVQNLQSFPKNNSDVKTLFDKLIEMNSKYYDSKQDWLNK